MVGKCLVNGLLYLGCWIDSAGIEK